MLIETKAGAALVVEVALSFPPPQAAKHKLRNIAADTCKLGSCGIDRRIVMVDFYRSDLMSAIGRI